MGQETSPRFTAPELRTVMRDYRTGGTPWFIVVSPTGEVIYDVFSLDAEAFIASIEQAHAPTN